MLPGLMMDYPLTMTHFLLRAKTFFAAREVVSRLPSGTLHRYSYADYYVRTEKLAKALLRLGVEPGNELRSAYEDPARGDRAAALLAVVGVVNVPIVHFSVVWWNSLHQGATIVKLGAPSMPGSMLWPLLSMWLGFMLFYGAVLCTRVQAEVLNRERQAAWVREAIKS